jgi:hypothetical protein
MEGPNPLLPTNATLLGNPDSGAPITELRRDGLAFVVKQAAALRSPLGTTLAGSAGILLLSQMVAAPWSRLALGLMAAVLLSVVVLQLGWRLLRHELRRLV